jgi:hypothetical protein
MKGSAEGSRINQAMHDIRRDETKMLLAVTSSAPGRKDTVAQSRNDVFARRIPQ